LHLILSRRLEAELAAWLSQRVSRILACSQAAATSLVDRAPLLSAKTRVLYNPLPHANFDPKSDRTRTKRGDSDRFTLGVVGRITETKGHHLLLQALAELPSELREKIRLIVVGAPGPGCEPDARYAATLRADAVRLGLDHQIHWAGYLDDPGASYVLMDVLIHPALAEAMCIVILEALDRGIPVIAARTGGIPEVVQDGVNGLLISPDDPGALTAALTVFLEDGEIRERLKAGACCSLDSRFSMEVFSSNMRAAIGELCPSSSDKVGVLNAGFQKW